MQDPSILFIGYGKIASRAAMALAGQYKVWAMARSARVTGPDMDYRQVDVCKPEELSAQMPTDPDIVVYCLSPGRREEAAYRATFVTGLGNVLTALRTGSQPRRLIFVSSTSVYHQDDGSVVDESSATQPATFAGQILLEAEALLSGSDIKSTCVRFSGIYGGGRSKLIEQVRTGDRALAPGMHLTNRIHEDDCVGFLLHLISLSIQGVELDSCYLATDSCPVEMNEVLRFIATENDLALATGKLPVRRRAGNKRCNNHRMLSTGYRLRYPSYREGYRKLSPESQS
ncbi:MAG: NAD(P)-dependent oxidoreductase [Oleiphilus sp.]|nr:MAG: NAD(P)-dependent oxidoreductase [Oleiphilus sp.]